MQTAVARVRCRNGSGDARIILDTASTRSFCRTAFLHQIGAEQLVVETLGLAGIGAESRTLTKTGCYEIEIIDQNGDAVPVMVNAMKAISCSVDKQVLNPAQFPILSQLKLADPVILKPMEVQIDILIGQDRYYDFVGPEQIRLGYGLVLLGTRLGYVAAGSVVTDQEPSVRETTLVATSQPSNDDLDDNLRLLWGLEHVGIKDWSQENDDIIAERQFKQSIRFNPEQRRYSVRWPWKSDDVQLPSNFNLSLGQLRSLLTRMPPELLARYHQIIQDQLDKDVIELAPETPDGERVHHIPHHCIERPDRATTKLRVVYNASSKSSKALASLNDCLYRGPVLMADLCGVLMRFRLNRIGIISDVEKAYLQVELQDTDRDVTRFIWVKNPALAPVKDNLVVYRFKRVLFGVVASQFMLAGTIRHHLSKLDSPISTEILRNIYVDNLAAVRSSTAEAIEYYHLAKDSFSRASMNLREWQSNDSAFMASIPEADRGNSKSASVLGLAWDLHQDTMTCTIGKVTEDCNTKRGILRAIARVFDPCGFMNPVTIEGKMILQELWSTKCDWDAAVPNGLKQRWEDAYENIKKLPQVLIPRFLSHHHGNSRVQLHCFVDASKKAYAVAAYLRMELEAEVITRLIFSKARVCPINKQELTITRLELTAADLGSRIAAYVEQQLDMPLEHLCLWTDNTCVFYWIRGKVDSPVFVKNRVKQICSVPGLSVRYVPTDLNPADLSTRGITTDALQGSDLWWLGPRFLQQDESHWPAFPSTPRLEKPTEDEVPLDSVQVLVAVVAASSPIDASKFSSFRRLLRVTAWIYRYMDSLRAKAENRPAESSGLGVAELSRAKRFWLHQAQIVLVPQVAAGKANFVRQLGLYTDNDGLLRCSGRLSNSDLPDEGKFPILLDKNNHVSFLVVKHYHEKLAHAGAPQVLAELRREFWLIHGRSQVRKVIRECRFCRRIKGGPYRTPPPPPLPSIRSTQKPSFAITGLDYLGPLYIRGPTDPMKKVWICLFTCGVTRAVHLEVVEDMSSEQFLLGLRRFIAACGVPETIVCDNAKQFRSAQSVIDQLRRDALQLERIFDFTSGIGIRWRFIVELAPWMGGFYERMVGLVKRALRGSLSMKRLSVCELQTVCAEVAAILNRRPLTYCEENLEQDILTPSYLIQHNRPLFPPTGSSKDDPDYTPKPGTQADLVLSWKRLQSRLDHFWQVWRKQYLASLRERGWFPNNRNTYSQQPQTGHVVLVHDNLPGGQWRLGKVVAVNRSSDGACRSAKVRMSTGKILQRPLKLLYPIELTPSSEQPEEQSSERERSHSVGQGSSSSRPKRVAAEATQRNWQYALHAPDSE